MGESYPFIVDHYSDSVGGNCKMCGSLKDGDCLVAITAPGCWGPMITPSMKSGHEVTCPVKIENTEPGDAIAIFVEDVKILSRYAASGTGKTYPERYASDPSLEARCPNCGQKYPETVLKGIGENAVRCSKCGAVAIPQTLDNGYTVVYDETKNIAVTVQKETANAIAAKTERGEVFLPEHSSQNLATILAAGDVTDLVIRPRPMIGNIACSPAKEMPSSKNSGDLIESLNRTGLYGSCEASDMTDGHMDINVVGKGCILLSPVKVPGAGLYVGDVHLTQGDGELAGHTIDLCSQVTLRVKVLKGMRLDGPVIIPVADEIDERFRPFKTEEYEAADSLLKEEGSELKTRRYPIMVVGTGKGINAGIDSAVARAAKFTGLSAGEIKNLATVGGDVRIGRTTGSVFLTISLTEEVIERMGILEFVKQQYQL